jgi:hypothetical protein
MKLITAIVNSIGLLFDIAGAILVAIEVVNIFKGEQYKITVGLWGAAPPPEKTKEYEKWEKDKFKYMKLGLCLLIIGFLLQLMSNWIPILLPNTT